jgi:hypothetical protein
VIRPARRLIGVTAVALFWSVCVAFCGDLTTLSGKTYRDYNVTRVEPDGLSVTHHDGVAKISFSDLSEDLRKKYGYDSGTASEYARRVKEEAAAYAAAKANAERDEAKLKKIRPLGVPASVVISQVLPDGILGEGTFFADAGYKVHDEYGTREAGTFDGLGFIFVRTTTKGLADGETWSGKLWPAGIFRYGAVSGAGKTVRQYATSPEQAIAILDHEKTANR